MLWRLNRTAGCVTRAEVTTGSIKGLGLGFYMTFAMASNFEVFFPNEPNFVDIIGTPGRPSPITSKFSCEIPVDAATSGLTTFWLGADNDTYVRVTVIQSLLPDLRERRLLANTRRWRMVFRSNRC
jgi:hypothetical protein